jgi:hypothetical protein
LPPCLFFRPPVTPSGPSGEEAEVLETHPELLDDGLVAAMLEEAENLR